MCFSNISDLVRNCAVGAKYGRAYIDCRQVIIQGIFKLLNKLFIPLMISKPGRSTETQIQTAHKTCSYVKVELILFNTKFERDQAYPLLG